MEMICSICSVARGRTVGSITLRPSESLMYSASNLRATSSMETPSSLPFWMSLSSMSVMLDTKMTLLPRYSR